MSKFCGIFSRVWHVFYLLVLTLFLFYINNIFFQIILKKVCTRKKIVLLNRSSRHLTIMIHTTQCVCFDTSSAFYTTSKSVKNIIFVDFVYDYYWDLVSCYTSFIRTIKIHNKKLIYPHGYSFILCIRSFKYRTFNEWRKVLFCNAENSLI